VVKLWDVASREEIRSLPAHTNSIYTVAFSPDGMTLATGSMDQTVKLWDVATGRLRETIIPGEAGEAKPSLPHTPAPPVPPAAVRP
jgi:WD40 repeat protein